jgi:hypothetical protein
MKKIITYVVIALIAFAIGAFASSKWFKPKPEVITKETVVVKVETRVDSIPYTVIDTSKVKIKTVIVNVPSENPMGSEPVYREVKTIKYKGKEELNNGTIDYEIYADNLLGTKFKLTTKESTTTKTIETETILPAKSRIYISGGLDANYQTKYPTAASVGFMYNRRQKWGVGLDLRQDFSGLIPKEQSTTVGLKVYIGL